MGQAKLRGTFAERRAAAVSAEHARRKAAEEETVRRWREGKLLPPEIPTMGELLARLR